MRFGGARGAQVVAYNTVIDLLGKMGRWEEALKMYMRMRREGLTPVTRTYNTLMIAANNCGQWKEALGLYDELLLSRQALNTTSYNALISAYTKAGSLPKVLETFQRMFDEARPPPTAPFSCSAPAGCVRARALLVPVLCCRLGDGAQAARARQQRDPRRKVARVHERADQAPGARQMHTRL